MSTFANPEQKNQSLVLLLNVDLQMLQENVKEDLPPIEVKRRLRLLGQPITLFGEVSIILSVEFTFRFLLIVESSKSNYIHQYIHSVHSIYTHQIDVALWAISQILCGSTTHNCYSLNLQVSHLAFRGSYQFISIKRLCTQRAHTHLRLCII